MIRIAILTVLLILLVEGFLTEALQVTVKEGQMDWITESAKQLADQSNLLYVTIISLF